MAGSESRREMAQQYRDRKKLGGVFLIRNTVAAKALLDASTNLSGSMNRFAFAQETGTCVYLKMQKDWEEQGGVGFAFEILEELEKGETQTDAEFAADIKALKELWLEKLTGEALY
ncbi:MAG: GIY-YIG nuclease family protein [Coriobacteriia bacterium]|nr:GIY-YIG nuclease family protein [Coriobacteriia bacterium]